MKVLNAINFEIYSTENKKSMKAFKQGCQTIFASQKNSLVEWRMTLMARGEATEAEQWRQRQPLQGGWSCPEKRDVDLNKGSGSEGRLD